MTEQIFTAEGDTLAPEDAIRNIRVFLNSWLKPNGYDAERTIRRVAAVVMRTPLPLASDEGHRHLSLREARVEIERLRIRLEVPTNAGTMDGIATRQAVINVQHQEILELRAEVAALKGKSADSLIEPGQVDLGPGTLPDDLIWETAPEWATMMGTTGVGEYRIWYTPARYQYIDGKVGESGPFMWGDQDTNARKLDDATLIATRPEVKS